MTSSHTSPPIGDLEPTIDTKILSSAANFPPDDLRHLGNSTFLPSAAVLMYIVHLMDSTMASSKNWTDNSTGWVPPYTMIYISTLFYIQVLRAMSVAAALPLNLSTFLTNFLQIFPPEILHIPGPLVRCFKDISSFCPDNSFGNVTPALPDKPGWSRNDRYALPAPFHQHLPNVAAIISRLHAVCAAATREGVTESSFSIDGDGPNFCGSLFRRPCDNSEEEHRILISPGMSFILPGSLKLWRKAAFQLRMNGAPPDFDGEEVDNSWPAFLRFGPAENWFGPVLAMMSRYCQYWRGSAPLSECYPSNSPTGGVKCTVVGGGKSTLFDPVKWNDRYELVMNRELTLNSRTTIVDIPHSFYYSAVTFCHNLVVEESDRRLQYSGEFWDWAPDVHGRDGISVLHVLLITIIREYHSYSRLQSRLN